MTQVFILAGQSNMEGQAVVDLTGRDYNDGRGTLATLIKEPRLTRQMRHLQNLDGSWRTRKDVHVWYKPEGAPVKTGPLGFGFTPYLDAHHFGPELQFGHVVGDAIRDDILLIKCAWGGKSLYRDFRPPSAGGVTGKYYRLMMANIQEALKSVRGPFELAGFVWYHGWNDGVDPRTAVPEYESNLVHLIQDVRRDLGVAELPIVVGEITGAWRDAPPEWTRLRDAQRAASEKHPELGERIVFVPTRDFVRKPEDSPNPGHGHHEFGNAETYFLVGDALGKGILRARGRKTTLGVGA